MSVRIRLSRRAVLPALAIALVLPALGWASSHEQLTLQPESRLWVDGGSTVRNWTCKAGEVNATVEAAPNGIAQVTAGAKGVRTVRVVVPSEKMDCGNGTMNDHMKKALKVGDHPTITFVLSGYDVAKGADGLTGTLRGTLDLGGVQKPIAIPAEGKAEGAALRVNGSYELKMSDFDLTPPSLMFGRIKVRDAVNVKFDLLLKS